MTEGSNSGINWKNALQSLRNIIQKSLKSVEIIPGDWTDWVSSTPSDSPISALFPFLLVEGNLGVPQKVVYKLYMISSSFPRVKAPYSENEDQTVLDDILEKTTCILVVNPAHQTALNTRKRLMQRGKHSVEWELRFIELLARGIKSCAKESALWDHRRWCLHLCYSTAIQPLPSPSLALDPSSATDLDIPPAISRNEFAIVKQAATIYPRNYHAWSHWRYMFILCCSTILSATTPAVDREEYSRIVLDEFSELRRWIDKHVTDTSAVHHLLTCLPAVQNLLSKDLVGPEVSMRLRAQSSPSALTEQGWAILTSFQPYKETGWVYLQGILPHLPDEERELYVGKMAALDVPWCVRKDHFVSKWMKSR